MMVVMTLMMDIHGDVDNSNDGGHDDVDDENGISGGSNDDVMMESMTVTLVVDGGGSNDDVGCDKEKTSTAMHCSVCFDFQ